MTPIYIVLICVAAALALCVDILFIYFSNNLLGVTRYAVESPKIKGKGVRVVHLTDLHGKSFGRGNAKLIKKVAAQQPDVIVITGDIIHKYRKKDVTVAENVVKELAKIAPVYYVSGNHEMRSKKYRALRDLLTEAGANVLDDAAAEVCGLRLCGVNCASIKSGKYFNLVDEGKFNLLLAHLPHYIPRYASAGYDCALCGHAHGGQWRIPLLNIGIYSPGQGLFPEYTCGVYPCGGMKGIVNRGLGNSECPLRLFNPPEIVVVDFLGVGR